MGNSSNDSVLITKEIINNLNSKHKHWIKNKIKHWALKTHCQFEENMIYGDNDTFH